MLADLACVKHGTSSNDKNTEFRIIVDGTTTVALSNSGGAYHFDYRSLQFSGTIAGLSAGSHTAEVEYRTKSGTVTMCGQSSYTKTQTNPAPGEGYERITAMPGTLNAGSGCFEYVSGYSDWTAAQADCRAESMSIAA